MKRFSFKKLMLTIIMMATVTCVYSQGFPMMHLREFNKHFMNVDTLVLENAPTVNPTEDGDYLIALPKAGNIVIAFNADSTKAIVRSTTSFVFIPHRVYTVKNDDRRLVLWYKDDVVYCGYVYDKKAKAGQYYEAFDEKEREKIMSRLPFMRRVPHFAK